MNDGLIPKRYAKALYKLAVENGDSQEIYEQLKPLSQGFSGLDDVKRVVLNPYVPEEDKGRVMLKLWGASPAVRSTNSCCWSSATTVPSICARNRAGLRRHLSREARHRQGRNLIGHRAAAEPD